MSGGLQMRRINNSRRSCCHLVRCIPALWRRLQVKILSERRQKGQDGASVCLGLLFYVPRRRELTSALFRSYLVHWSSGGR